MSSSGSQPSSQGSAPRKASDYYDLDSIVFSQTIVPLHAAVNVHGLGFLDPSGQDEEDLAAGAELKLPLWLAESLVTKRMATASLPKTHNTGIRGHLTNDPASMNFASNPYIYELGAVVATLTGDTALPPLLSSIFTARFAKLWDHSRNWSTEDTASATAEMCNSEKKLFHRGYQAVTDYRAWANHKQTGISAAPVVQSISRSRKRSRSAD